MGVKGEALPRSECHAASVRGRVRRPCFIFPQILPPEASGACRARVGHDCLPSVKLRAINSFMISLVPP
jgi:hypothetical protein